MISEDAQVLLKTLNKKYGGRLQLASQIYTPPPFRTGSLFLDLQLGGGWPANQFSEVVGWESHGKALSIDTPIPTPDGWTTMGKLKVGDEVFDQTGTPCNVTYATDIQFGRRCFRLSFSDGSELIADAEHQWTVIETSAGSRRRSVTATTAYLIEKGVRQPHGFRFHIPTAEPVRYSDTDIDLPVDPYVLGAWLGDGASVGGTFTCADDEIVENIRAAGYDVVKRQDTSGARPYGWGIRRLAPALRDLGVLGNKHIPEAFLRASISQRLALLQGLMDTDGYSDKRGHCEFSSIFPRLANGVYELLTGLGHKVHQGEGAATLEGRYISQKYRLTFSSDLPIFRLARKAERCAAGRNRGATYLRAIRSIDAVESVPVRCIQVDSPTSLYLAGHAMIPTHNTAIVLKTIAAQQKTNPDFSVLWIAAEPYNVEVANFCGVDNDRVIPFPTKVMEEAYETILEAVASKSIDCVVLDSYPALIAKDEADKHLGDAMVAVGARLTSSFCRRAGSASYRERDDRPFFGVIVNQWRTQIGAWSPHGQIPKIVPGGYAKNYFFYLRLEVQPAPGKEGRILEDVEGGQRRVGVVLKAGAIKNKQAPPNQIATIDYYYDDAPSLGFHKGDYDVIKDLQRCGILTGVVSKNGRWYSYNGEKYGSRDDLTDALRTNPELCVKLEADIRAVGRIVV